MDSTLLQPVGWTEALLAVPGSDARLAQRHCRPSDMPARGGVVLAAAIGVPQTFYTAFAEWLAARGLGWGDAEVTFYSDSPNDLPLLEVAQHPVATNPSDALRAVATDRCWRVLDLFA